MEKLYYLPGACSLAVHIALEWAGAEYQAIAVERGGELIKSLNPQGAVPVLVDPAGEVLTQAAAILLDLAERYPAAHLAGEARSRRAVLRYLAFCNADLHPAHAPYFVPQRFLPQGGEAEFQALKEAAMARIAGLYDWLASELAGREYFVGNRPTIADAYGYTVMRWSRDMTHPAISFAPLRAFIARMEQNAGVVNALIAEGLETLIAGS